MVKNYRELYLLVLSAMGRKVGFTFRKIDGTVRSVVPTERIVFKDNALRFFCPTRNAWRAASLGSVISVTDDEGRTLSDAEISETISSANNVG